MNAWRMAFRNGDNGQSFWPRCKQLGVAAISYYPLGKRDLSHTSDEQFRRLVAHLAPSQQASLRRVRYEMKAGDVIYVKEGQDIVEKGVVKGAYGFDKRHRIRDDDGNRWTHQVPVQWDDSFRPITFSLGPEQRQTVAKLRSSDVDQIEKAVRERSSQKEEEFIEGERAVVEAITPSRSAKLRAEARRRWGTKCSCCGFDFGEFYGPRATGYIQVHHRRPLATTARPRKSTIDDVHVVCANCHVVLHLNPPLELEDLRKLVKRRKRAKPRTPTRQLPNV